MFRFNDVRNNIPVENWNSDCDTYIESNLLENNADYLKEWVIYPPKYMDFTGNKTNEIAQLFNEALPNTGDNGGVIFVEYNSFKHANLLSDQKEIDIKRRFDNRIVICSVDLMSIINIRVTESDNLKDVIQEAKNCADDSKDLITLIKFLSENGQLKNEVKHIHNMVCANDIDSQTLDDTIEEVKYLCPGCIPNVITKENLASKDDLSAYLLTLLRPSLHKEGNKDFQKNDFLKIIGHIACYMANTSIKIVSSSGLMHDHKVTVQLNEEQATVAVSSIKHKLIKGGYGVGKTIIGILNLEFLTRIAKTRTIILFISFDPFSLLDCYVSRHMESLQLKNIKNGLVQVEILNISSMANKMERKTFPMVSDILEYAKSIQEKTSRKCYVVLDEVSGDSLNSTAVKTINEQLETMIENYITIILQPCQKHRTETEVKNIFGKKTTTILNTFHLNKLKMKIFTLTKCMRNSVRIHNLVESAQNVISTEPSKYFKPKVDEPKMLEYNKVQIKTITKMVNTGGKETTKTKHEPKEKTKPSDNLEEKEKINATPFPKQIKDLDAKHKLLDNDDVDKSSNYTTTSIQFEPVKQMGHSREGPLPRLLHLPSSKRLKSCLGNHKLEEDKLVILKLIICLVDISIRCGDVVICNNSIEITFFKYALSVIKNIPILLFAPYLQNKNAPDLTAKEEAVTALEKQNKVILTDMHSFCGMQSQRIIIPTRFDEKYERQNIIENIARTTDELIIIITDTASSILGPQRSTFGRVIKEWESKKLVQSSKPNIDTHRLLDFVKALPTEEEISKDRDILM